MRRQAGIVVGLFNEPGFRSDVGRNICFTLPEATDTRLRA
jgi:hypothetical protein